MVQQIERILSGFDRTKRRDHAVERAACDFAGSGKSGQSIAADRPHRNFGKFLEVAPKASARHAAKPQYFAGRVGTKHTIFIMNRQCLQRFSQTAGGLRDHWRAKLAAEMEDLLVLLGVEAANHHDKPAVEVVAQPASECRDIESILRGLKLCGC